METLQVNPESSSPTTSSYVWEVPGKNIVIHLDYGVVDRLLIEVMRGFGAIPRRGAEVGGILLGTAETGEKTIIRVEDFEPIVCEHRRGPSYLLSETDTVRYEDALARQRYNPDKRLYAVGCYRSHTREGMALSPEDLKSFDSYFPQASSIFLLVKPFATKVSMAGFFFRESDGHMHSDSPYLDFPFRRRELGGGASPASVRHREAAVPVAAAMASGAYQPSPEQAGTDFPPYEYPAEEDYGYEQPTDGEHDPGVGQATESSGATRVRKANIWVPLSFIFLLLGALVGFQAAIAYRPARAGGLLNDPFSLSLAVGRSGDYLHIRWDRQSQAIRTAQRGVLTITEGTYDKKVDLDVLQLQNPTVYYRNMSDAVRFRLEIYTKERVTVSETLEWRK